MTRQNVLSMLRGLISGQRQAMPLAWHVEEGVKGNIRLSIDGARFDIDVRAVEDGADSFNEILDAMSRDERDVFARSLDEAADEAEREGPVSAEELRRDLDEAIRRGHEGWEARSGAVE